MEKRYAPNAAKAAEAESTAPESGQATGADRMSRLRCSGAGACLARAALRPHDAPADTIAIAMSWRGRDTPDRGADDAANGLESKRFTRLQHVDARIWGLFLRMFDKLFSALRQYGECAVVHRQRGFGLSQQAQGVCRLAGIHGKYVADRQQRYVDVKQLSPRLHIAMQSRIAGEIQNFSVLKGNDIPCRIAGLARMIGIHHRRFNPAEIH